MNKFYIMIEETDCDGNCTDYFQAHDNELGFVAFDTLEQALEYVNKECGSHAPFNGKYRYHIQEVTEFVGTLVKEHWIPSGKDFSYKQKGDK